MRKALKKRLSSTWIGKLLIIVIIISVAGASIDFWIMGKRVEASLAEQMLHRQQVVARAGAQSIEDFLASVGSSVSSYAQFEKVIEGKEGAQDRLNLFVKRWFDTPVFSIALTDSEGIVVVSANRQGVGQTGVSIADRDYFQWSRDKALPDEVFIGQAIYGRFGSVEDEYLIPVASGVFSEGKFKGVLIATVVISELTKVYLNDLKIDEETRIYLIDASGNMLHAPHEKFIGANYFDYLASVDYKGKEEAVEQLWQAATATEEGKVDVSLPNELTGEIDRFLISHSPVKYQEGGYWALAVASPINTALAFFPQFNTSLIEILVFIIFVVIVLSCLAILVIRLAQREAFYEGFTRGRDHSLRTQKTETKEKN